MNYTYVLESLKDRKWYTGQTRDLKQRVRDHLQGRVVSTRGRRPLQLIYCEACLHEFEAIRRERFLKSGKGKRYLRKRLAAWIQRVNVRQLERPRPVPKG